MNEVGSLIAFALSLRMFPSAVLVEPVETESLHMAECIEAGCSELLQDAYSVSLRYSSREADSASKDEGLGDMRKRTRSQT